MDRLGRCVCRPGGAFDAGMEGVGVGESPGLGRDGGKFEGLAGWRCGQISPGDECLVDITDAHIHNESSGGIEKRCAHGLAVGGRDKEGFDSWRGRSGNAKVWSQLTHEASAACRIELRHLARPKWAGELAIVVGSEKCDACPDLPHIGDGL